MTTEIKPLENYWVVVQPDGTPTESIRKNESYCIADYFGVTTNEEWESLKLLGWTCQQVNITFEISK